MNAIDELELAHIRFQRLDDMLSGLRRTGTRKFGLRTRIARLNISMEDSQIGQGTQPAANRSRVVSYCDSLLLYHSGPAHHGGSKA